MSERDEARNAGATGKDRSAVGMPSPDGRRDLVRHGGGFLVSGLIAFSIDALVLWLLTRWAGLDAFSGRLVAIGLAMVAGWLSHRRLTFNVSVPPSFAEFGRYAAVAWTAAALNYAVYAAILLVRPGVSPLMALVAATVVAMSFSYLGMRFGVFRQLG
jgi:putative flippase GtrA